MTIEKRNTYNRADLNEPLYGNTMPSSIETGIVIATFAIIFALLVAFGVSVITSLAVLATLLTISALSN